MYYDSWCHFVIFSIIELTIEECEESDHSKGIDITNQIIELPVGARNIWINAKISTPNPFKSEIPTWKFRDSDSFPHGIELSGSNMKFTAILQSKEQVGNYTVSIGDYEAFFTLLVQGENQ